MDAAIKACFIAIPIISAENARVHALIGMRLRDAHRAAPQVYGYPLWWLAGTYVGSRTHENVIGSGKMKKIFSPAAAVGEPSRPGRCKGKKSFSINADRRPPSYPVEVAPLPAEP
jgi:hypothetical protein